MVMSQRVRHQHGVTAARGEEFATSTRKKGR
jgi:hypothetical protein